MTQCRGPGRRSDRSVRPARLSFEQLESRTLLAPAAVGQAGELLLLVLHPSAAVRVVVGGKRTAPVEKIAAYATVPATVEA